MSALEHKPFVSQAAPDDQVALCLYKPPGAVTCLAEAVWHGVVLSADRSRIETTLPCCDAHKPSMAISADSIHPVDTPCGVGQVWYNPDTGESGCRIDWDQAHAAIAGTAVAA